jgi:flagellar L-ring protein precursor FlgH
MNKSKIALSMTAVLMLTACGGVGEKIANIGKAPPMTEIQNPYNQEGYRPVTLPMPPQEALNTNPNSLWQPSRQTFFKDQRAGKVGDILTILIDIKDEADLENTTTRTRAGNESMGMPEFLGIPSTQFQKVLPDAINPESLVDVSSDSSSAGSGKIEREEEIRLKLAAMITQVLPNGNFVIQGRQEVRVNHELRELTLNGVIRPEDILNNNSISYDKIAEARISYGGRGHITDAQQPRYGQQFYDIVWPF